MNLILMKILISVVHALLCSQRKHTCTHIYRFFGHELQAVTAASFPNKLSGYRLI